MNSTTKITTARRESVRPGGHCSHQVLPIAAVQVSTLSRDWLLADLSAPKWSISQQFMSSKKCQKCFEIVRKCSNYLDMFFVSNKHFLKI